MHIAIDIYDISATGGLERFSNSFANSMRDCGHRISCFTSRPANVPACYPLASGITVKSYPFTGDTASIPILRQHILDCSPDIFISPASFNNPLLWCAILAGTGIPLVYSEHSDPWKIESERWNQAERQAVLWAADAVHLLLPPYLQSVPEALRHKCHVIPNPVPPANLEHRPCPEKPHILSLGRLNHVKQIPLLVQAFELLAADFPQWELHIWGSGEEEKAIRKAVARTAYSERIRICGLTTEPDQQFCKADIFCIPSRFEGFGLTVVEAFTHGVAVVGFQDCSGVNSLIRSEHNGLLAPQMTAASLAQSLRRLMEDAPLRQRMGTAARESARAFAPERIYDQWEAMLVQAAARKGQTQLSKLYSDENCSPEEAAWRATMREVLQRPNVLLQNRQIFRRFLRRHPALKSALKRVLGRK